uniref:EGF-like domain-containing protein n=1 Tax=Rhabditophanes sp. KR3021 TaxID=114890 RepID=A0AC35TJI0_9BILA
MLINGQCHCNYGWQGDLCNRVKCYFGKAIKNKAECKCDNLIMGIYCDTCKARSMSGPPHCNPMDVHAVKASIEHNSKDAVNVIEQYIDVKVFFNFITSLCIFIVLLIILSVLVVVRRKDSNISAQSMASFGQGSLDSDKDCIPPPIYAQIDTGVVQRIEDPPGYSRVASANSQPVPTYSEAIALIETV